MEVSLFVGSFWNVFVYVAQIHGGICSLEAKYSSVEQLIVSFRSKLNELVS